MPKKSKKTTEAAQVAPALPATPQLITETIEKNYMPYVMSVIISRAIPEIDGFKPSHRKLLYTMYKMGLLGGNRTKSANIVGATMKLNPHGDAAIYETMMRLTRGYDALLHPFVDSKGSFGKQYSTDMACSASRYTEARLDPFCEEIFRGIDKNAVDMIDNYDGTMKEPSLLPTSFPNILVSPNMGIAVGMASRICSFNLAEVCEGTIALLENPRLDVDQMLDIIKAPDFSGGGTILYDRAQMAEIYRTGRGSFRIRSCWEYDPESNSISIVEIPYSTSIEIILKKIGDLIREGKLKEVVDYCDQIDLNGFKISLDLRKGTDPDKLMAKLFKLTTLEDEFPCNFNVLINSTPVTLGVIPLLKEWINFRCSCVSRELAFERDRKNEKLHLLLGLAKILLDIDKAIKIIRETKAEKDVVPNLMEGFGIDELQANYIAEIKLRHLNREYILNRVKEIEELQKEIAELDSILSSDRKLKKYIANQLREIKEKYGKERKTKILTDFTESVLAEEDEIENYPVRLVMTRDGYFKKITMQSLRGNDEQALKEGDEISAIYDGENRDELIFFSDRAQCYKSKVADFDTTKASAKGDYVPAKVGFDDGERAIMMKNIKEYDPKHHIVFIFKNGKGVRIPVSAYETKGNRRRLTGAYSDASPIVAALYEEKPFEIMMISTDRKAIVINTSLIPEKTTRTSQGVTLFSLKKNIEIDRVVVDFDEIAKGEKSCKKIKIPATGVTLVGYDPEKDQIKLV